MSNNNLDRLDQRTVKTIVSAVYDDIVTQLLDVTKYPITVDTSDDNVVFNHQCYDKEE